MASLSSTTTGFEPSVTMPLRRTSVLMYEPVKATRFDDLSGFAALSVLVTVGLLVSLGFELGLLDAKAPRAEVNRRVTTMVGKVSFIRMAWVIYQI